MKLSINTGMETYAGVVSFPQVDHKTPLYQFSCDTQHDDLMTAVKTVFHWGEDSLVHGTGRTGGCMIAVTAEDDFGFCRYISLRADCASAVLF